MSKSIFNHKAENVIEAVGLNPVEIDGIIQECFDNMNDKQMDEQRFLSKSEIIEVILNKGLSIREISVIAFQIGESYANVKSVNPLHALMESLGEQFD